MSPSSGDNEDRDSMLDLPLRSGDGQADLPFGPEDHPVEPPVRPTSSRPPRPPQRRPRRPPNRGRWVKILLILGVLLVVAYLVFWPKPAKPAFSADPFVLEEVRVGGVGEPQTLTITNIGERPMPVTMLNLGGEEVAEFALTEDGCGSSILPPEGSCAVQIRLTPAATGQRQAFLEVHAEMPDSPARLSIVGEGIAPVMAVEPPAAEFGSQDVGSLSKAIDLSVINEGTAPMRITRVTLGGGGERDFRLTRNECSKSILAPGEICALKVAFAPRAAGAREAELVVSSDALEPVPTVRLVGEGVWTGAAFEVEPKSIGFGSHLVGTNAKSKRLQVVNRQATALRNIRVRLIDTDRGFRLGDQSCKGASLAPGAGCQIEVLFGSITEGLVSSLLEISQEKVGTLGIELQGRGVAPRWILATEILEFGDVRVGGGSELRRLELRNEGSAGAKVSRVEVTGADSGAFGAANDSCSGRDIQPGSGCSLAFRFAPDREGEHRSTVLFKVAAGTSPRGVELEARAIAPRLSLDREMVSFDRVHRTTRREVDLTLANRGTALLQLGPFSIRGDAADSFEILGGTCVEREGLRAGEQCGLRVAFSPAAEGRATARLAIVHDGISGPRELPLAGIGLPPPIPRILLDVARMDFGPQPIGNRSSIQTIHLRAGGTGFLELRDFQLAGEHPDDFHLVPATCHAGPKLQPGSDCTVGVRFIPGAAGRRTALLVIRHNASPGSSTIELTGEGLGSPSS